MKKLVLFDLDGTLIDSIDDLADSSNWVCSRMGWPTHTVQEYRYFVGNGIPKLVERFTPEACRTPETLARALALFDERDVPPPHRSLRKDLRYWFRREFRYSPFQKACGPDFLLFLNIRQK